MKKILICLAFLGGINATCELYTFSIQWFKFKHQWNCVFHCTIALEAHRVLTEGSVDRIVEYDFNSEGIFTFPFPYPLLHMGGTMSNTTDPNAGFCYHTSRFQVSGTFFQGKLRFFHKYFLLQIFHSPHLEAWMSSLEQPALHKHLSLPERNQARVLGLLLVAHISLYFGFEIESETKVDNNFLEGENWLAYKMDQGVIFHLNAPFLGRKSFTCLRDTDLVGIFTLYGIGSPFSWEKVYTATVISPGAAWKEIVSDHLILFLTVIPEI